MKKIAIMMLLLPCGAFAEVSDKMATQSELWVMGIIFGIVLALLLLWSKWMNILALPIAFLFFYFAYDILAQPDIGPAIIKEQGKPYIFALYGSASFVLLGVCIGNIMNKLKGRNA